MRITRGRCPGTTRTYLGISVALAFLAADPGWLLLSARLHAADKLPHLGDELTPQQAAAFARLALAGLDKEYPNKPSNVTTGPESNLSPRELHPAFFGCFDWHSSVHGHWMLVRLLKLVPDHPLAGESRVRLDAHLSAPALQAEADYFREKHNANFERMYGWAWLLRLTAELHDWDDDQGRQWRSNIRPLENRLVELTQAYLPKLSFPVRSGVHPDTAFALALILDYAQEVENGPLADQLKGRARDYYLGDNNYNDAYEPSGEDFFSPALNEADVVRRVLSSKDFAAWLNRFLPQLAISYKGRLLTPVEVPDVTDGKLVHLAGLNLSRAWTLQGIATGLPASDERVRILRDAAARHATQGLSYVFSGHYEGEHWLATFAIYALSPSGTP